jgi:hypothetical protein
VLINDSELFGQKHHAVSKKVHKAIEVHKTLKNLYKYKDPRFVTRAKDLESHSGYQDWHRKLDEEVAEWINNNAEATP